VADNSQSMSVSWSPYGKILQNNKAGGANLTFGYNAMQQRVLKRVVLAGDTTRTYYIRDAQGNTMGVYTRHNDSVTWREQYIFGSSRLGLYRADTLVNKGLTTISKLYEGKRNYELTNHLGNVMAVINDRKADTTIGANKGYNAVVISATDYFPFGMVIDSRSYTSALYRYGFNGKENDKETGEQDYGMRIYDPRGSIFLSIDPISYKYPFYSPYIFAGNSPIQAVDLDGREPKSVVVEKYRTTQIVEYDGGPDSHSNDAPIKIPITTVTYKFTESATHFLSLVSGISETDISKVEIRNASGSLLPAYDPKKGGGGMTFPGKDKETIRMNLTDNYFTTNKYGYTDYGDNSIEWLELTSHEVGHIRDVNELGGKPNYFSTFIKEYAKNKFKHDIKREERADYGQKIFLNFSEFLYQKYGDGKIKEILNGSNSEKDKIKKIDKLWNEYQTAEKNKKNNGLKN